MSEETSTKRTTFTFIPAKDGVAEIYSNYLDASWTLHDVRMRFAQIVTNGEDQFYAEERVAVTLPWQQAKVLRDVLSNLISRYEELNGEMKPINLP